MAEKLSDDDQFVVQFSKKTHVGTVCYTGKDCANFDKPIADEIVKRGHGTITGRAARPAIVEAQAVELAAGVQTRALGETLGKAIAAGNEPIIEMVKQLTAALAGLVSKPPAQKPA